MAVQSSPDHDQQAALRAALEEARASFHELVGSLSAADWLRKGPSSDWSAGELLAHTVNSMGFFERQIRMSRRGKGLPKVPGRIFNAINTALSKRAARSASLGSIGAAYDARHAVLLNALYSLQPHEFERSGTFFGAPMRVREVFAYHASHVAEHVAEIRQILGRS